MSVKMRERDSHLACFYVSISIFNNNLDSLKVFIKSNRVFLTCMGVRFTLLLTELPGVKIIIVAEAASVSEGDALLQCAVVVPASVVRVASTLYAW